MSKKFMLALAVALLVIMAYGLSGTGAWFTDTGEIANNSVTTGTLDLTVWGNPLTGQKLEPGAGYKSLGVFCARNDGDYDMKLHGWLTDTTDNKGLYQYVKVRAVINPTGNVGNYGPPNYELFTDVPLSELLQANNYFTTDHPGTEALYPGYSACWQIDAQVLETAPNTVQNATFTAKMYLEATQFINTGWSQ